MVRRRHNVPGRGWGRLAMRMGRTAAAARISSPSNSASAAKMPNTRWPPAVVVSICALVAGEQAHAAGRQVLHGVGQAGEVPAEAVELPDHEDIALPQGALAAVETGRVVADTGRDVTVDVDRVDAGRLQGVAPQVQRLRAVGLRDAGATRDGGPQAVRFILPALPLLTPCQAGRFGLHAQSSHPPPERVNSNPLRTPAAAGGADAAPGRTWNCGPASIPRP